ncbi:MFS transporter [Kribbella italica]|uniref:MFS family permease n=1 Tax=Kribbella italica TaxID=1540520 RepID=A0A7W9J5I1_9ACTN|nr:MFS transporter [Kribbella italica]MBB5836016.1 MFS family permease [Kribbella italica]
MTATVPAATARAGLGASYWRLLSAASLSSLADGTLKVALPLLARSFTDAPLAIAGVGFAAMLPWLLLSLPAGAIVDRADRKTVLLAVNLVRAAVLTLSVVLAVVGFGSIALIYVVAFSAGVAETFYATAASAIVPQLVDRTQLDRANALQQIADQATNQFAGPALGGVLVGVGVGLALGGPAVVWTLAVVMLIALTGTFRARRGELTEAASLRSDIAIGLRFLARSVALRAVCVCVAITNFAGAAAAGVFVVYAVGPGSALGLSPSRFGLLIAASAVGSVLGSLLIRAATRALGLRILLAINAVTQAGQIVMPVLTHNLVAIGTAYALGGLGVALWNVGTVTMRQRIVPLHLLGRVISTHRLVAWGSLALGALTGGLVAQTAGLIPLFWGATAMTFAGALALLPLTTPRIDKEALDAAMTP